MEIDDESDSLALAQAAKLRGNTLFVEQKFSEALSAYQEAIKHDASNHILYANSSACNLALAKDAWEPQKKVALTGQALVDARQCTVLGPNWAKGYSRQANAEFEVVEARGAWEERKIQDAKWAEEDKAREDYKLPEDGDKGEKDLATLSADMVSLVNGANFDAVERACRRGLDLDPGNVALKVRLQALRDAGFATDEAKDRENRNTVDAAICKAAGNKAFLAKKYTPAVEQYTLALTHDPVDHVFFSNRSACYASLDQPEKALADANRCVALAPQFAKGYSREGVALFNLGRYPEAELAAKKGLSVDLNNAALKDLLAQARVWMCIYANMSMCRCADVSNVVMPKKHRMQVQVETAETPAAQAMMFKLRQDQKKDLKMKQLMSSLNLGGMGNGMKVFSPGMMGGMGGGGLESLLSGGSGGFGNGSKPVMTEDQMRQIARNAT